MTVRINDNSVQLPAGATLSDALESRQISPKGIALAVNGRVIPKTDYPTYSLAEGDSIIIIKAFYGG